MRANIIHCQNNPQRLPILLNELAEQNITDYDIWDGIQDIYSVVRSINQSHKQIIKYAKLANWEEVLIMEDDIRFCGHGAFNYFLENKPKDFDLYIGGIYLGEPDQNNKVSYFTGMHCYIVSQKFYDIFLSTNPNEHIDIALKGLGDYYVSNPFTSVQYNGFSSNTRKEENYDFMFQNRQLYNNFQL